LVLIDTSVWIEVFRRRDPLDIEALVPMEEVATCLPIIQEVLQGFRDEAAFRKARESMFNLPIIESPLEAAVFEEAVSLYRTARAKGITVRSSVDCLIAACALRHDFEVWHRDRDYPALARVSRLRERGL
jgi:predicted nucleic acid-binding protein